MAQVGAMVLDVPNYPVSIVRLFLKMGGWVVIITGALLLMFSLISNSSLKSAKKFAAEGLPATAIVTDKYTRESRDSDGDREVTYYLTLDYTTREGEEVSLNRKVNSSEYRRAEKGGEFELLYLKTAPRKTELTQGSYQSGARITQRIALAMGLIWLVALWIVGGWAVAATRARRYGTREEAVVQDVRHTGVKINSSRRYRLVWQDASGHEGKSLLHRSSDFGDLKRGDIIHIYQGVKHSWWVGDIGERAEFSGYGQP